MKLFEFERFGAPAEVLRCVERGYADPDDSGSGADHDPAVPSEPDGAGTLLKRKPRIQNPGVRMWNGALRPPFSEFGILASGFFLSVFPQRDHGFDP